MAAIGNATPLAALDAVVIDTETTGLDPAKAWIVEIGAVRIAGGRIDTAAPFRQLVNPGEPIPAAAPQFTASTMRRSPARRGFAEVWPTSSRLRRRRGADRPFARLRSRRAQARMRARRHRLAAAAHARHAAARRGRRARSRRLFAGKSRGLARRRDRRAAFRAGRRRDHRARVSRAAAEAARGRHPHAGRGRARLPRADRRAGRAASRRLGRAGRRRRAATPSAAPHRQLSLSPPGRRRDERAGAIHRRRTRRSATRCDA